MKGLKDHEIAELVNAVKVELKPYCPFDCLRVLIHNAVMKYLESKD